jgi:uncharacterized membrane protein YfcA
MLELFGLVSAGFAGGILAGLLGIGGGIIYVLILPYALEHAGIPSDHLAQLTISNSIFGVLFASLSANYMNIRNHDFYPKESFWVGIPGAIFSIFILKGIVVRPWYSVTYFYAILILFLGYMLVSLFLKKGQGKEVNSSKNQKLKLSLAGMIGGSLAASTGLGGGAAVVPILTTRLHLNIKKARSISLAMIFMTAMVLTFFNLFEDPGFQKLVYQKGLIYFPAALPVTIGVLLGSPVGSKLGRILSANTIKILFGVFILIVIIEKFYYLLMLHGN